jgi:hypothetical protein
MKAADLARALGGDVDRDGLGVRCPAPGYPLTDRSMRVVAHPRALDGIAVLTWSVTRDQARAHVFALLDAWKKRTPGTARQLGLDLGDAT